MRPFYYSSLCLAQCARRMSYNHSQKLELRKTYNHSRKAININKLLQVESLIINKTLAKNQSVKNGQWATVRDQLLKECEEVNEVNVDCQVYDICFYYNRIDQGIDYYEFLDSNNYPLNLATMTSYLRMMALKKTPLTDEEENNIIRVYNKIKKEHEILDPRSASYCILGISLTKQWQEGFKLLDMIKMVQNPGIVEQSSIIAAAFKNNQADLAWQMIEEALVNMPLTRDVYIEYLNYCKRNFSKNELIQEIEKMFFTWQKYNVMPHKFVIDVYEQFFKSIGHNASHTFITMK